MVKSRKYVQTGLILFLFFLVFYLAGIYPHGEEGTLVSDQAGLLSQEQVNNLSKKSAEMTEKYKMNFVVLTCDDAQGKTTQDYADDFYMEKGYYEDGKAGGAVVFLDMDNRQIWLSTAGDMGLYLTDQRVEQVIDGAYGYVQSQQYYECLNSMLDSIGDSIDSGISNNQYNYDTETGEITRYKSLRTKDWLIAVGFALLLGIGACGFTVGKYQMKWGTYKYPYREKGKLDLNLKEDRFVNQIITQRRIPKDTSGGGGGSSGRTSTHTSSGGGTFGGGGRGF